jgi:hypothetical protein
MTFIWLLFEHDETLKFTGVCIELRNCLDAVVCVLHVVIFLLLGPDVVRAITEWSFPVFFKQIGVILFVLSAGTRGWVSVFDTIGNLVVLVASDTASQFKSLIPSIPCHTERSDNLVHRNHLLLNY